MRTTRLSMFLGLVLLASGACAAQQENAMQNSSTTTTAATATAAKPTSAFAPTKTGHVPVNGVRYYYAIYGQGEPVLLLHGGLGSIEMFGDNLQALAKTRTVIGVDLHGHGRTQLGNRKIDLVDQGRDLGVLLDQLGYSQVDVIGYSMGAGVAFQLAAQSPAKVRRLVLASGAFSRDGFYPEMLPQQAAVGAAMAPMMKDTPMFQSYAAIAPDVSEFPKLLDQLGELMRKPYDWSADVKKLTMPTMLVFGDSDMYRLEHVVEFYKLLGGGQRDAGWQREHQAKNRLAILPDVTHYDLFVSPRFVDTTLPFLDGKSAAAAWTASK